MKHRDKTKEQLISELEELRRRVDELEKSEARPKPAKERARKGPVHPEPGTQPALSDAAQIQVSGIQIGWKAGRGLCTFENLPVAMMWVDTTLAGLMSGVQAMVGTKRFGLALQGEGRNSVKADWKIISQFSDFREGFKAIANIAAVAGWGKWELTTLDQKKKNCHFRVWDSWEGRYQKALGVCWGSAMLAGKMAGYCSKLFDTNCWAEQTAFSARGDEFDEFAVGPSERSIEEEIENLLASDETTRADMAVAVQKLQQEVTERKRAQEALRQSEEQLKILFEFAPDAYFLLDLKGKIVDGNRMAEEVVGYRRQELIGENLLKIKLLSADVIPKAAATLAKSALGRGTGPDEFTLKRKDGTQVTLEVRTYPVKIGNRTLVLGIGRDITERKQAEEALRDNQDLLNSILESTGDGILVGNMDGTFSYSNSRFAEIWKISPEDMESKDRKKLQQIVMDHVKDPPSFLSRLQELYQSDQEHLDWVEFKDGRVFERFSSPMARTGEVIGRVWSLRDITERKRAEEALRESEERYRSLFKHNHSVMLLMDPEKGDIVDANRAARSFYGWSKKDLTRMNIADINTLTRAQLFEEMERAKVERRHLFHFRHRLANGEVRDVEVYSGPIRLHGRELLYSIVHDITARRLAEAERARLEQQLVTAQKMEAVGTLAGGIAHDFNNLLQAIQGYADLLLLDKKKDAPGHLELREIFQAARRGSELTRQLLTFSRKVESKLRPTDLNREVENVRRLLARTIPKMIRIELHLEGHLKPINADPAQMEQILVNLALNAKDSMPDGGRLTIETGNVILDEEYCKNHLGARPGEYVLLALSDTGQGMDRETLEHIFEPFYTTKGVGEGSGLGLAMVYGIVKNHAGHIVCTSEPGAGTTFKIHFPVIEQQGASLEEEEPEIPLRTGTETILFVDDEDSIRYLGEQVLTKFGYRVLTAADGDTALSLYRQKMNEIDLVILDLIMPEMGGRRCLEQLLEVNPRAKVLIASGYTAKGLARETLEAGAKGFVSKPYLIRQMLKAIGDVLDEA